MTRRIRRVTLSTYLAAEVAMLTAAGAAAGILGGMLVTGDADAAHRWFNNGHWSTTTWGQGHYTVADWTGSNWPVYASQIKWDESNSFSAAYVSGGSSCPAPCVTARSMFPGEDPVFTWDCSIYGRFDNYYVNSGNHFSENMFIRYNRACSDGSGYDLTQLQHDAA